VETFPTECEKIYAYFNVASNSIVRFAGSDNAGARALELAQTKSRWAALVGETAAFAQLLKLRKVAGLSATPWVAEWPGFSQLLELRKICMPSGLACEMRV